MIHTQTTSEVSEEMFAGQIKGAGVERAAPQELTVPTARRLYLSALLPDEKEQEILERNFFSSIRLSNGTYKYTYPHRLDDLNELVNRLLPRARPLQLMDVAMSSGVSTLEWTSSLSRDRIEHQMVAGDLTMHAFLVSAGEHLHVLVDGAGYPLQFEFFGKAVPNPPGKPNLIRYFLPLCLMKAALAMSFRALREACLKSDEGPEVRRALLTCRRIALVSPRLQSPAKLELVEDDILAGQNFNRRFHALRAANILNRAYFDEPTLMRMLVNLRLRLARGGLLIVCRTNSDGVNHATIFVLNEAGAFEVLSRLGDGSEIEALALGLPPLAGEL